MHIQILKLIFSIKIPYKDFFSNKNILTYTGNKIMPKKTKVCSAFMTFTMY